MATRGGAVHVATTKRVYKGKTYVTHLLRRSIRKGKSVTHETLGNLSHLPDPLIAIIKRSLKSESFVPAAEAVRITRSLPNGHVHAVLTMIRKLGLEELIASEPSRRRDRRCRNTCVVSADPGQTTFRQVTEADALQAEALRLITMETETGTGNFRKPFVTID